MSLKISGLRKELSPASRRVNSKNRFQGWETTWNATGNTSHSRLLLLLFHRPWSIAEEDFLWLAQTGVAQLEAGHWTNWPERRKFLSSLGFYPSMLPGPGKPHIPLLWEAGIGRALPFKSFWPWLGRFLDLPELQCPYLYNGHGNALVVLWKELNKMSVSQRTEVGSLGQEGGRGWLPLWEHQKIGRVSTDVWAPGMQVIKQGFQAGNTGIGQQRVLLQTNKQNPTEVNVRFCYQWVLVSIKKKTCGFQNNLDFRISNMGL